MKKLWKPIEFFPGYSVSSDGEIMADKTGRILVTYETQYGLLQVGMMKGGVQHHRSVPLLVARAFLHQPPGPFDTPINLNGDRHDNRVANLAWRPRWFAVRYNQQFRHPYPYSITSPIQDIKTGEVSENSLACAMNYGLLEEDVVLSISSRTYVWPTYQEFRVLEDN